MRRKAPVTLALGSQQESRNQVLFRQVNERVREVVAPVLTPGEAADFLCECGDQACIGAIRLDLEEYDAVRASPNRFVVIPGHEDGIGQATVQGNGRFVVVERSAFREEAAAHDPRRQTD
jgi:hypothetical protein